MTGVEPGSSEIESNRSVNCATNTALGQDYAGIIITSILIPWQKGHTLSYYLYFQPLHTCKLKCLHNLFTYFSSM